MIKENLITSDHLVSETSTPVKTATEKSIERWTLACYVSFVSGVLAAVAGILLGAESYAGMLTDAGTVNSIANFLIIAAFPLLMTGAHSLDRIADLKSQRNNNP